MVNREQFLQALQSVSYGLSEGGKDTVEQSSCFCFCDGEVLTFNDNVFCRLKSGLPKNIKGAVKAEKLLEVVMGRSDEDIEVKQDGDKLILSGKDKGRWKSTHNMEVEILLPVDGIRPPDDWKKLDDNFSDAVGMVASCVGTDDSQFAFTCIHITPKWVEACNNLQACRWRLPTPVEKPILVRGKNTKHISSLGVQEIAESDSWVHFKNAQGLIYSVRRYVEDYGAKLSFKVEGEVTKLPKGLEQASKRANIFSRDNTPGQDLVKVTLKSGKLIISGEGIHGSYEEQQKVEYDGQSMCFFISPVVLADLVKRHNEVVLSETRMLVEHPNYKFLSVLSVPEDSKEDKTEEAVRA